MDLLWCTKCKKVVWAYDHSYTPSLFGWLNQVSMPCPLCKEEGNFDGWSLSNDRVAYEKAVAYLTSLGIPAYDGWSILKGYARTFGVEWIYHPTSRWSDPRIPLLSTALKET